MQVRRGRRCRASARARKGDPDKQVQTLPPGIGDGDHATAIACEHVEAKTTPPKPYTEASLIADMRSVAKYVQDPKLKAVLKETSGIGTAATQAETIETLKRRSFIRVDKKAIRPTELGCQVIASIPQEMTDPGVTAAWEDALGMIAKGKYAPALFMKGIDAVVERWLGMIRASARDGRRITAEAQKPTSRSSASAKPARSASLKPARKGAR